METVDNLDPEIFREVERLLLTTKLAFKSDTHRKGLPKHHSISLGMINQRGRHNYVISCSSILNPELFDAVVELGEKICNFDFHTIHVIKNAICNPHKDKNNVGKSLLVSVGDYTGCNINVKLDENTVINHNAHYHPIFFDGSKYEHWNDSDLVGDKISLIFYTSSQKHINGVTLKKKISL